MMVNVKCGSTPPFKPFACLEDPFTPTGPSFSVLLPSSELNLVCLAKTKHSVEKLLILALPSVRYILPFLIPFLHPSSNGNQKSPYTLSLLELVSPFIKCHQHYLYILELKCLFQCALCYSGLYMCLPLRLGQKLLKNRGPILFIFTFSTKSSHTRNFAMLN